MWVLTRTREEKSIRARYGVLYKLIQVIKLSKFILREPTHTHAKLMYPCIYKRAFGLYMHSINTLLQRTHVH